MDMMEIAITRVGEQIFTSSFDGKHVSQFFFFIFFILNHGLRHPAPYMQI